MNERSLLGLGGKVALVTGGGAGIGRGIVDAFAELGCSLVVAESDPARAAELKATLGPSHLVVPADVTDESAVEALFAAINTQFGRLDIVVNNVGHFLAGKTPFEQTGPDLWDALYRVNLRHVFLVTKAAIPLLRASGQGGSVITLSTIEAFRGIPGLTAYAAFKSALTGVTRSLALELAPDRIRVNQIAPETTETDQVPALASIPEDLHGHIERWYPIGRFGTAQDSAGAAIYLASDLSLWVTGTTIHVDGGALAAGGYYRGPDGDWSHYPVITGTAGIRAPSAEPVDRS